MNSVDKTDKLVFLLAKFSWHTYEVRLCNSDVLIRTAEGNYSPEPHMELKAQKVEGGVDEDAHTYLQVLIGADQLFTDLTNLEPHARVSVQIQKITLDADDTSIIEEVITIYKGTVAKATRNYKGRQDVVRLELENFINALDIPQGIISSNACSHIFSKRGCNATVKSITRVITEINDTRITLSTAPTEADLTFNKGTVEFESLFLDIKEWVDGTYVHLREQPPASWLGKTVTMRSGCDKRLDTCKTIYNNEQHFRGLGVAMTDYSPIYESR